MFIKIMLNNFFKSQSNMLDGPFLQYAHSNIQNDNVTNEIRLMRVFKRSWRETLNYSISNEEYKVIKFKKVKTNKIAKVYVSVNHSFFMTNTLKVHKSCERLNYIIILKKDKLKWKIENLYIKEYFQSLYKKVSELNHEKLTNEYDLMKINFWEQNIKDIKKTAKEYNLNSFKYRTNYLETNYPRKYNPSKAVIYAKKYALSYNKAYNSFHEKGGDCTNFVSQCIHFGGVLNSSIWKPYSYSWIRVNELYYYLLRRGLGIDVTKEKNYKIGSILQFYSKEKGFFSHSGIITESLPNGDYLYSCHSYDRLDYPLSEIYPFFYKVFRVIEIVY